MNRYRNRTDSFLSNIKARIRLSIHPERKLSILLLFILGINLYGNLLRKKSETEITYLIQAYCKVKILTTIKY